jgi:hypothetical protein
MFSAKPFSRYLIYKRDFSKNLTVALEIDGLVPACFSINLK